ncbi:MAG TPA: MFS transporter [Pirellulales bacterium]|jgi:MFS family permease|nr:MFS transporter [Pirellulales bacterium]
MIHPDSDSGELKALASATSDSHAIARHDPYAALRVPAFRRYMIGNFLAILGLQMQSAAIGLELYRRTKAPIALALVGLVQVLPVLGLAVVAGHVADRFNRRNVIMTAVLIISAGSAGLANLSAAHAPVAWMYGCLFFAGLARAFQQPAKASMLPQLVKRRDFPNAVTWNSAAFQLASVLGPAMAGIVISIFKGAAMVFVFDASFALCFFGILSTIHYRRRNVEKQPFTAENLAVGIRFVWRNKVILAASSLDMFGVLFGAAVALVPIYADDILKVGNIGYGMMMAAPAAGAVAMSFVLSHLPPMQHAGKTLLCAVTGFGVATVVFGFSRWFPLSLAMLFMTGAMDNISVVVRQSLIQLLTPDEMRGRVSAINGMFISVSNEVGDIESGTVAQAFRSANFSTASSATISAVTGGAGTLAVVAIIAWLFPQLRGYGKLDSGVAGSSHAPSPSETVVADASQSEAPRAAG